MSSTDAAAPENQPAMAQPKESKEDLTPQVPRRAHTYQGTTDTESQSPFNTAQAAQGGSDQADDDDPADMVRASVDMGELPIELVSLTDR